MAIEIPRAEKAPQEGFLHEGERRGRGKGVAARVGAAEIAAMGKGSAQEGRPPSHRNAPSGHSGVAHGLFYDQATPRLDLQNAHASGSLRSPYAFAPERPFGTFRCSGRLILRKEYIVLFAPKRSTFRFAALTLRVQGSQRSLPPPFTAGAGTSEKEMRQKTEGRSAEKLLK